MTSINLPPGMEVVGDMTIRATETTAQRKHRHRMEVRRFWVEDAPVHVTAIAIAVVGTVAAMVLAFRPGSPGEERRAGISILTHLLSAVAGFAFGKKAAK